MVLLCTRISYENLTNIQKSQSDSDTSKSSNSSILVNQIVKKSFGDQSETSNMIYLIDKSCLM
jgi:hypothetical protein